MKHNLASFLAYIAQPLPSAPARGSIMPATRRVSQSSVILPGLVTLTDEPDIDEQGQEFVRRVQRTQPARIVCFPAGARAFDVYPLIGTRFRPTGDESFRAPRPQPLPSHACNPWGELNGIQGIAYRAAWRLENPKLNRKQWGLDGDGKPLSPVKFLPGSNQHKRKVSNRGVLTGFRAHSVQFQSGCPVSRIVSDCDLEEIQGIAALHLFGEMEGETLTMDATGLPDGGRVQTWATREDAGELSFSVWKGIFSDARVNLRMNRKEKRESLARSLEEMQASDLSAGLLQSAEGADALSLAYATAREDAEKVRAQRARILKRARKFSKGIHARFNADTTRKRVSAKRGALRTLRDSVRVALGTGGHLRDCNRVHKGGQDRNALRMEIASFLAYVSEGWELLDLDAREETGLPVSQRVVLADAPERTLASVQTVSLATGRAEVIARPLPLHCTGARARVLPFALVESHAQPVTLAQSSRARVKAARAKVRRFLKG